MIIEFVSAVGHRFCAVKLENETRRLFVTSKGQSWTQKDIATKFQKIGAYWLGIPNFGPHVCRSFWAAMALNSGQVSGSNIQESSSFLQVGVQRPSAWANTAAHNLGNEVLGAVVNSACTGATSEKVTSPNGKKLKSQTFVHLCSSTGATLNYFFVTW